MKQLDAPESNSEVNSHLPTMHWKVMSRFLPPEANLLLVPSRVSLKSGQKRSVYLDFIPKTSTYEGLFFPLSARFATALANGCSFPNT
jgi:hypothetical protein